MFEEWRLNQSLRMMSSFRPWIRKKDGDGVERMLRKKIFHRIGSFDSEDADVFNVFAIGFFANFPDTAQKSFDGEETSVRMRLRSSADESSIAGSEIEVDGRIVGHPFSKNVVHFKGGEPGCRLIAICFNGLFFDGSR